MSADVNQQQYNAEQIQVLEGLEPVRKRPGMYIGSTGPRGLHHLVYEIVDNSVDEALAGYCSTIGVTIQKDNSIVVEDDGRGMPVDKHPKLGIPAVEVIHTVLHAGGKFGGGGYKVSGGLHGVGASVVNALSTHMEVEIRRNGKVYKQTYERGKTTSPLTEIGTSKHTGSKSTFWPDPEIFEKTRFKAEEVKSGKKYFIMRAESASLWYTKIKIRSRSIKILFILKCRKKAWKWKLPCSIRIATTS